MKTLRFTIASQLTCLLVLLLCGCQTPPVAGKKPMPVSDADLLGTWVGLTEDDLDYFRIDLRPGGKGLCAYVYAHNEARLSTVTNWGTRDGKIQIAVSPIDDDPNQVTKLTGSAYMTMMELTVVGKGWQRRLVLRREDDMERKSNLLKTRMNRDKADVSSPLVPISRSAQVSRG